MSRLYDYVLGAIPVPMVLGYVTDIGIISGSVVAALFIFYLLFVNPPRDPVFGPHQ